MNSDEGDLMCACGGSSIISRTRECTSFDAARRLYPQIDTLAVHYETRPFVTYAKKYCLNPRRHVFGTLPCCYGLKWLGTVDPRDLLTPPPSNNPLRP